MAGQNSDCIQSNEKKKGVLLTHITVVVLKCSPQISLPLLLTAYKIVLRYFGVHPSPKMLPSGSHRSPSDYWYASTTPHPNCGTILLIFIQLKSVRMSPTNMFPNSFFCFSFEAMAFHSLLIESHQLAPSFPSAGAYNIHNTQNAIHNIIVLLIYISLLRMFFGIIEWTFNVGLSL